MNLKEYEKDKMSDLSAKLTDPKLTVEERKVLILKDISDSLAIIAGKIGRKLL